MKNMNRREFLQASAGLGALALAGDIRPAGAFAGTNQTERNEKMRILVLTGSPRKNGNSNELASRFIEGAMEAGHEVFRFDAAESNVHPCIACNSCGMDGPCVFNDDFEKARKHIIPADLVAFATPLCSYGLSAQLKTVIDRFYAINGQIHVPKRAVLLMTFANSGLNNAHALETHYEALLDYLGWKDAGRVIAPGVWTAGSIKNTSYPEQAYQLGKNL